MMNRNGHGFLQQYSMTGRVLLFLCFITCWLATATLADPDSSNSSLDDTKHLDHNHVSLIYSEKNKTHAEIVQQLSRALTQADKNIHLSLVTGINPQASKHPTDLVIVIGTDNIDKAESLFGHSSKLLIASNPGKYSTAEHLDIHDAVLYMTQPYCRQLQFIKLIYTPWHTISYLSSRENPAAEKLLLQCAKNNGMDVYRVNVSESDNIAVYVKDALSQSDLILALPDEQIYNSKTVKNILLTSYRSRKPVIAFSRNFVNAGALASIYSNTEQISLTATTLVNEFFRLNRRFERSVYYPLSYEISINKQVFRALDLPVPDTIRIKQALSKSVTDNAGKAR